MLRVSLLLMLTFAAVVMSVPLRYNRELLLRDSIDKRDRLPKREALADKRDRHIKRAVAAPSQTYYTGFVPVQQPAATVQTTYYYVLPDGTVQYVQGGQSSGSQVQYQPAPVQQPTKPSGGFLGFLSNPLNAAGDIVKAVGDTASNIVNLPFKVVDTAIEGVGLADTGVGQLATGILDVGEAILQTPVQVVSGVAQAPFRLASGVAGALDE